MIFEGQQGRLLIVIKKGEKLVERLTQLLEQKKIQGGMISGLGALTEVELGYYDLEEKNYIRQTFSGDDFELISLTGNLTLKDQRPYVHVHALLGRRDFSTFGGHLFEATVAVTTEVSVIPLGKMPIREMDQAIGLGLICGLSNI